jgi:hypothetical protein
MSKSDFQAMALRVALNQAIACKSDEYDKHAQNYASKLTGNKIDKTQVRGLESLANMTDKVSDITDWLRLRVGRDSSRERWAKEGIGRELLSELEGLRNDAQTIVAELSETLPLDADTGRQIHLRLCRELLRHLAAHFEYLSAEQKR